LRSADADREGTNDRRLPPQAPETGLWTADKPLFLTIKSDLSLALGNDAVSRVDCRTRLRLERSWTVSSALPSA